MCSHVVLLVHAFFCQSYEEKKKDKKKVLIYNKSKSDIVCVNGFNVRVNGVVRIFMCLSLLCMRLFDMRYRVMPEKHSFISDI
mmetsp:Transcript_24936/g.32500  ORF Transcript_24936/g.32500 Transcript_24936/m.32500 type:complete len:83 (-) Transcript_24936:110-358(-)